MTTLNATANQAWHDLGNDADYLDSTPFNHQQHAFEEGWETGYKAATVDMLQHIRALRAGAITAERQNAYDRAIEAVQGLS